MSLSRTIIIHNLIMDVVGDNQIRAEVALSFINSDAFDALCEGTNVDPNNIRRLIKEAEK